MISNSSVVKFVIAVLRSPPISCRRGSLDPTLDKFVICTEDKGSYFETFGSLRRGFDIFVLSLNRTFLFSLSFERRMLIVICRKPNSVNGGRNSNPLRDILENRRSLGSPRMIGDSSPMNDWTAKRNRTWLRASMIHVFSISMEEIRAKQCEVKMTLEIGALRVLQIKWEIFAACGHNALASHAF
jgi:hypothetical protein